MTDLREQAALRDQCTVFLTGHGPVRPADLLASIPADTVPDRYGDGGVVAELEAEIAALFVSFYKGIGALAGCCLAGPADVLAEVREWRKQMGGTLHGLWPGAASALSCLRRRLPLMPEYLGHAREIASALRGAPGVRVVPDPPQVSMMHLLLTATQEGFAAAARRLAAEQGVWTWPQAMVTPDPGVQRVELYVGDATRAVPPDKVRDIITALAAG
jgi:threonine aldolase